MPMNPPTRTTIRTRFASAPAPSLALALVLSVTLATGILLVLGATLAPLAARAADGPAATPAAKPPKPPSTAGLTSTPIGADGLPLTNTLINCQLGASYLSTNAVFRGSVRVFDPNLYMECELLTVYFPSNTAASAGTALTGARSEATPTLGQITAIVAQTNVLIMMRGATIIGDRAVYWATNDIIQVTGAIVVIETDSGYAYGTNFIFNRRSMEIQSVGPSTLESKPGIQLLQGSNGLPSSPLNPGAAPRPKRNPAGPGVQPPGAGPTPNP